LGGSTEDLNGPIEEARFWTTFWIKSIESPRSFFFQNLKRTKHTILFQNQFQFFFLIGFDKRNQFFVMPNLLDGKCTQYCY
jgi:hypothetical protein